MRMAGRRAAVWHLRLVRRRRSVEVRCLHGLLIADRFATRMRMHRRSHAVHLLLVVLKTVGHLARMVGARRRHHLVRRWQIAVRRWCVRHMARRHLMARMTGHGRSGRVRRVAGRQLMWMVHLRRMVGAERRVVHRGHVAVGQLWRLESTCRLLARRLIRRIIVMVHGGQAVCRRVSRGRRVVHKPTGSDRGGRMASFAVLNQRDN